MIRLSPSMPAMNMTDFVWLRMGSSTMQKIIFQGMVRRNKGVRLADWLICNSTNNLDPGAFILAPKIVPIGPLLENNRLGNQAGNFWPGNSTCLKWLHQQPPNSVIYIAFGSLTVFNQTQFQERALGLELTNRSFLWVVRPDFTDAIEAACPDGFVDRVGTREQMVGWAPQQKVLRHPCCLIFETLWLELYNVRCEQWCPFPVLALLCRLVHQPELHL